MLDMYCIAPNFCSKIVIFISMHLRICIYENVSYKELPSCQKVMQLSLHTYIRSVANVATGLAALSPFCSLDILIIIISYHLFASCMHGSVLCSSSLEHIEIVFFGRFIAIMYISYIVWREP